jgi:hypothetical protein
MKTAWKLLVCWVAYVAAVIGSGVLMGVLKLAVHPPADNTSATVKMLSALAAGAVLVLGLWPLARGLAGSAVTRMAAVCGFLLLALTVNTVIEARVFTDMLAGGMGAAAAYYGCLVVLVGGPLGLLFGEKGEGAGLRHLAPAAVLGRGLIAWLSWPLIYTFFGMCVAPIVTPYYRSIPWLHIPPLGTIEGVQLVRSVIFIASSLPLIALWKGSRRGLWLTLGLAHAATVGLFGLAGGTMFPMAMRIAHSFEITGDSFAYAGVLVLLFSGAGVARERAGARLDEQALQAH